MKRLAIIVFFCFLFTGLLFGQVRWVPYERALEIAAKEKRPILIHFSMGGRAMRDCMRHKEVLKLAQHFICVEGRAFIIHGDPTWPEWRWDYPFKYPPAIALADHKGDSRSVITGDLPITLSRAMTKVLSDEFLQAAQEAINKENYSLAAKRLSVVLDINRFRKGEPPWVAGPKRKALEEAQKLMATVEEAAKETLTTAQAKEAEKDYFEAVELYKKAAQDFPGTTVAKTAEEKVQTLLANPEVQKLIEEKRRAEELARLEARAKPLYEEARALDDNKDFVSAMEKYEILVRDYPETNSGKLAKARLNALKSDEELMKAIEAERKAREEQKRHQELMKKIQGLMSMAKTWEMNERYGKAIECYEEVIRLAPDTVYAKQAARKIEKLKEKL